MKTSANKLSLAAQLNAATSPATPKTKASAKKVAIVKAVKTPKAAVAVPKSGRKATKTADAPKMTRRERRAQRASLNAAKGGKTVAAKSVAVKPTKKLATVSTPDFNAAITVDVVFAAFKLQQSVHQRGDSAAARPINDAKLMRFAKQCFRGFTTNLKACTSLKQHVALHKETCKKLSATATEFLAAK